MNLHLLTQRIRKQLGPQFAKPANRKHRPEGATASWGNCYVACEALWHLGARDEGYVPAYLLLTQAESALFASHWILIRADGSVLDPTVDQFTSPPDYSRPKRCGFLTKRPSYRGQKLIALVKADMKGSHASQTR